MRKFGAQFVVNLLPEQHKKLIGYLEKEKRKALSKKERNRILELMGGKGVSLEENEGEDAESSDEEENLFKGDEKDELSDSDEDVDVK
jgi:hypothetical protein